MCPLRCLLTNFYQEKYEEKVLKKSTLTASSVDEMNHEKVAKSSLHYMGSRQGKSYPTKTGPSLSSHRLRRDRSLDMSSFIKGEPS